MSLPGNARPDPQGPSQSVVESSGPGPDDPRVIAALEEYAAALKAGGAPERQAFLARHPEIAAALAQCLDGLGVGAPGHRLGERPGHVRVQHAGGGGS